MSEYINRIISDDLARTVWDTKYAVKDKNNNPVESSIQERLEKIATEILRIENSYNTPNQEFIQFIKTALLEGKLLPGGSNLFGIGNDFNISSLSNCFVIDGNNEDSYGSIMRVDEELVQVSKRRGGVGVDISHIRPAKSVVQNAALTSSGAISFMSRFSHSIREVGQEGRRGALMLTIDIRHPDSPEFVTAKANSSSITGANISIKVPNDFMKAVEYNEDYILRYPVDAEVDIGAMENVEYNERVILGEKVQIKIKAKDLWKKVTQTAWKWAEPGVLFWDTVIDNSTASAYNEFRAVSTNPCGEIPLSPYDSCRLLSINLTSYVKHPFSKKAKFDMQSFVDEVKHAVRAMDNIIDLEVEKLKQIIKKIDNDPESLTTKATERKLWVKILTNTLAGRRLGISVIGHADVAAMLGHDYLSGEALALYDQVHKELLVRSYLASIELAKERGAFKLYSAKKEIDNTFIKQVDTHSDGHVMGKPRRNVALLTIPPAGSISILAGITSGIEPLFQPFYKRRRKLNYTPETMKSNFYKDESGDYWEEYNVVHPGLLHYIKVKKLVDWETSAEEIEKQLQIAFEKSPYYNNTSDTIDPIKKVQLQGKIQQYIDHAISVTHNLPKETTVEQVEDIYMEAWKSGCKGCTIYRDGSRSGVLITKADSEAKTPRFQYKDSFKRPKSVECDILTPTIHGSKYIVTVGLQDGLPYEVFAFQADDITLSSSIKKGQVIKRKSKVWDLLDEEGNILVEDMLAEERYPAEWGVLTKLCSLALRHGAGIAYVVDQLNDDFGNITNVSKVIARQLKRYIPAEAVRKGEPCPVCESPLIIEGGCKQCMNCGYGKC